MRHAYAGERAIKNAVISSPDSTTASTAAPGTLYLPATPGQVLNGLGVNQQGRSSYDAYKARAVFPNYVSEGVRGMIGVMHNKPPVIELPSALAPLRETASVHGEGLELLLRRINEAQLVSGRIGLLLDLPDSGNPILPYIATYDAETIINWDTGYVDEPTLQALNMLVLDESGYERVDYFEWKLVQRYRVLMLGDPFAEESEQSGVSYRQGVFEATTFSVEGMIEPVIRGQALEQIPFVFINSTDLLPTPLNPPLLELANLCLAIYRGEADYRQSLFLHGQDTFTVIGGKEDEQYALGCGAALNIPLGGDAKFVGVNSAGLPEQRSCLENDRKRAAEIGAQLLDTTSRVKESAEALRVRVAAQTATLNQIALAGAMGLEMTLKTAARWVGADENAVSVTPNTEFAEMGLIAADILALMQAKAAGAPLSDETIHDIIREAGFTELEFAEEVAKIKEEQAQNQDPVQQINLERSKLALAADKQRLSGNPDGIAQRIMDEKLKLQNPPVS